MYRKTLLAFSLMCMLIYIPKSYAQDSCSAPSCPSLSISGPDKISYWESKYYTLTSDSSRNIRWSVDNPGAYITGDDNGATLVVGSACNCNNGSITITAKDTETGCSGTFKVQAGTWVETFICYSSGFFGCGYNPNASVPSSNPNWIRTYNEVGLFRTVVDYSCAQQCWPPPYVNPPLDCYDRAIANGGTPASIPPLVCPCTDLSSSCPNSCNTIVAGLGAVNEWKCPTPSQSCATTCSLNITDFKSSTDTFDPYSESICLSGLIDEATGKSIEWKIEIKDDKEQVVKHYGGGSSYVAASWNGRDDNGDIVPDGKYTTLLTAKTGDGKCTTKRELDVTVQTECRFTISTDPKEVWPQIPATQRPTGYTEDWTKAKILVSLTKPAPVGGCNIDFTVEPVENTGGHDHSGGRPKGTVEPASVNIPSGTEGTVKAAVYTSNMVSGEEKIIAKMKDKDGNEKTIDEEKIKVNVPGLGSLGGGTNLITWTSTEKYHKLANSNYGTSATIGNVQYAVGKYVEDYELIPTVKLAVVDMSLPWGGLFDVDGNWSPSHDYHRVGKSVDFSKYYRDDKGNVISVGFFSDDGDLLILDNLIDQDELDRNFGKKKCARWEKRIGKIHYECKQ